MSDIYENVKAAAKQVIERLVSRDQQKKLASDTPLPPASDKLIVLYSYTPTLDQVALQLNLNDELKLKKKNDGGDWWYVKNVKTGKKGYVPKNFVAAESEKEHLDWYSLDMTREKAAVALMEDKYAAGSFIVRPQQGANIAESVALSLKRWLSNDSEGKQQFDVVHFTIRRDGNGFKIDGGMQFKSIALLVNHYAENGRALKQRLTFSVKKEHTVVWEIEAEMITIGKPLAQGHFGKVYKGALGRTTVALKMPKLENMTAEDFKNEALFARPLVHENIVQTIGMCLAFPIDQIELPLIVSEYMANGSLKEYLMGKKDRGEKIKTDDYRLIALKVATAMAYLEKEHILHRDLAARNVLVGADHGIIKLADFGMARRMHDSAYYRTHDPKFPYKWTAPEAFVTGEGPDVVQKGKFSSASDVWSFGVFLWELYSDGEDPYKTYSNDELLDLLIKENFRLRCPTSCTSNTLYPMMNKCWELNPEDRPTFAQLVTFLSAPYGVSAQ